MKTRSFLASSEFRTKYISKLKWLNPQMVSRQIVNKTLHVVEKYLGKTVTQAVRRVSKAEARLLKVFRETGGVTVNSA
ncbi:MAG: hypothetical protein ACRCXT_19625 [Paraclostridium sp.]